MAWTILETEWVFTATGLTQCRFIEYRFYSNYQDCNEGLREWRTIFLLGCYAVANWVGSSRCSGFPPYATCFTSRSFTLRKDLGLDRRPASRLPLIALCSQPRTPQSHSSLPLISETWLVPVGRAKTKTSSTDSPIRLSAKNQTK